MLFYLDPALESNHGHHANSCRAFRRYFDGMGLSLAVFANRKIDGKLRDELNAIPLLTHSTYWQDGDELAGWFNTIDSIRKSMADDLNRLPPASSEDTVFINSVSAPHLLGVAEWVAGLPAKRCPIIVAEFGHEPGVDPRSWPPADAYRIRTASIDSRAVVYRSAVRAICASAKGKVFYIAFEDFCARLFSAVIGCKVHALPSLTHAIGPIRARTVNEPLTIGFAGSQRKEKGYHLVPEIVQALTKAVPSARFLVHNSGPSWMKEAHAQMRACAADYAQVRLLESPADDSMWADILKQVDLMVCPYDPKRYHASYSAVACEVVASGMPLVVPNHTSLSRLIDRYHAGGATFDDWTSENIVAAVARTIECFDRHAAKSSRAALEWSRCNGPQMAMEALGRLLTAAKSGQLSPQESEFNISA